MKMHGLAKVEIKAKEIEGATVVVEYKLVLTNEGELPTSVNKVIDYLPDGLEFSSELNKSWVEQRNGELINTSLTNQKIEAGESVELELVLTKSMTANSTGTFTNTAEIGEISNSLGTKDTDSTPGNKAEQEDDYSKADLIISVSTGAIVYMSITLGILVAIGIIVYLNIKFGKFKINKKSIFGMILIGVIFVQTSTTFAAATYDFAPPESVLFHYDGSDGNGNFIDINSSTFTSISPNIGIADCIEAGHNAFSRDTVCYWYADEVISSNTTSITEGSLVLTKLNEDNDITISEKNSNYIIGPLKINRADDNTYTYQVMTSQGRTLTGVVCDANGNNKSITGQNPSTFYLKVPVSNISSGDGIASVKITASASITKTTQTKQVVKAKYKPLEDGYDRQAMKTRNTFTRIVDESKSSITQSNSIIWLIPYGDLEITKQDADNSDVKLEGVQIKVTGSNFDKTYTTDANGKVTINDLKQGTYTITEISNPYYGYNVMATGTVTVKGGMKNTYTLKNTKQTGNLKIEKQDADSGNYLEGVSFNIKRKDENKYIQVKVGNEWKTNCEGIIHLSDMRFVDNEENATVFTTNKDGIIEIRNILKGTYEVKEISVGDGNSVYEIDDDYITWSYTSVANDSNKGAGTGKTATVAVWRRSSLNTENPPAYENRNEVLTFKNQKKYISLSGYVWLDQTSSKQSIRNDLYKTNEHSDSDISLYEDDRDELLEGIKVTLKDSTTKNAVLDKDGNAMTTTTTKKGSYLFEYVEINKLSDYYVEFEYNGLKYQNVEKNFNKDTGSKAEEGEKRQNFNNKFETVTNTKRIDGIELQYTSGNHESILNNSDSFSKMQANTYNAEYNIAQYYDKEKDIIENINLGLYEREQPDLAVVKDIQNVQVAINGYTHVYNYAQRFENSEEYGDGFNVGVKFGNTYGSQKFQRPIYKSDVDYSSEDDDNELKVYVTYKIQIKNENTKLITRVNTLLDYYDEKYTLEKAGIGIDDNGNIIDEVLKDEYHYNSGGYKGVTIDLEPKDIRILPGESQDIYVQFSMDKDTVYNIMYDANGKEITEPVLLNNVTEIYSYTTYEAIDGKQELYAGVDSDSKPGNAIPGEEETYEDDTDSAPGLQLVVANARKIAGTVFLDNADSATPGGAGNERLGDGMYNAGETTISGVKVGLYKASDFDGNGNIVEGATPIGETTYNEGKNNGTGDDGTFTISNFVPGDYKIVYFWGDGTYSVNDYKGTIYKQPERQLSKTWYTYKPNSRFSDAMDNYKTREKIDSGEYITTMDSITPAISFGVEMEDIKNSFKATEGIDKVEFVISNVDFGIVERPRQEINVDKRISTIKLTLANGQTIVDAIVNENGVLEGNAVQKLIYMAPSNEADPKNGLAKIELDNELIQGATIQIGYKIVVENNSEKDYNSEYYYKYGILASNETEEETIIKITPSGIYDYLDSSMTLDEDNEKNDGWDIIKIEEYNNKFTEEQPATVIEEYLYSYYSSIEEDGNTIEITGYESFQEQYGKIITEWTKSNITSSRQKRLANKTILHNDVLEEAVEPGGTNQVEIFASKVLSNSDEIELNNDVEITKVERNSETGREVTPTNCVLYDIGESVTVTPSTGENRDYKSIVILTISLFTILGTGIVFIKKKVLG